MTKQRRSRVLRPEAPWWSELSTGYLQTGVRRGLRPRTVRAYHCELIDFGRWLYTADVQRIGSMDREHIEAWQDDMRSRLAPGTQRLASVVVRNALKWAANEELPLSKPTLWQRVVPPRTPRLKPRPIPVRDLTAIINHLERSAPTVVRLRTRALFWLILSSGARISEALSLDRYSIVDRVAVVIQKGGSDHALMISAKAQVALNDYLQAREDTCPAMFVSYRGPQEGSRLEPIEANRSWTELCIEVGIPRFTSHQIRHSCATQMIRGKVNVVVAAKHMGHRGLGSMQGYVEVDLEERLAAVQSIDLGMASLAQPVQLAMAGVL